MTLAACSQPAATTTLPPEAGVEVVMIATPIISGEEVELCTPGMVGRCHGVILQGDLPPELVSPAEGPPLVVRVEGVYDGRRLIPSGPAQLVDDFFELFSTDFSSKCPELQGAGSPDTYSEAINRYTQTVPESYAGM
ncbi:MAG TPA: hypothetical protein VJR05_06645, partial [Acidimicrobiia bacterium]|nr:hypothetical protein [Acidimicrobiia bacterium]